VSGLLQADVSNDGAVILAVPVERLTSMVYSGPWYDDGGRSAAILNADEVRALGMSLIVAASQVEAGA
jgi:hypothetical protein